LNDDRTFSIAAAIQLRHPYRVHHSSLSNDSRFPFVFAGATFASHDEHPSYPLQLSDAVIASFSLILPPANLSKLPPARAADAASCQAEFAAAATHAQACLRTMRATWLKWQQLASDSPGDLNYIMYMIVHIML
jgi:hypothetical protein